MDIKHTTKPLTQFVENLLSTLKLDEVIIFGSYLHGNASRDSDVDVLIISDDFKNMDIDERDHILYDAIPDIEPIVEPWGFTRQELNQFDPLSTVGHARDHGLRFKS